MNETETGEVTQDPSADSLGRAGRRHGRDLTTGSIPRHMVAFSLPILIGSALHTAYSFVDAIWVGHYLGRSALAAVTVSFPVVFVLVAVGGGLTMATGILVGQHYGARDAQQMRRVVDSSVVLMGGLSVALTLGGSVLAPHILRAMDTPAAVLPLATGYMRIFLLGIPFGFGLFLTRSMLQGIGDSATPLYFQGGAVMLNIILDPLLMLGWLGFPRLGLDGAAWATVVSQGLALAALLVHLKRRHSPVAPSFHRLRVHWPTAWVTVRIGTPAALQQSLVSISMVFVIGIVNRFGESATAAYGAASRVDQLAFMPALTLSLAVSTFTAQNIGAHKFDRVRATFWWGLALAGSVTLLASILALTIPATLLRIFTSDPAVIRIGIGYLRVVGACYICFAALFVSNGVINGAGHTFVTALISLVSLWVVRVPFALYLSNRLGDVRGIWYAIAASFAVTMCASLGYFSSGRWRRPVGRASLPRAAAAAAPSGDGADI